MIHSPSRSYNEAFEGVGLLNHPHRLSDFSTPALSGPVGCSPGWALTRAVAINSKHPTNTSRHLPFCLNIPLRCSNEDRTRRSLSTASMTQNVHADTHQP